MMKKQDKSTASDSYQNTKNQFDYKTNQIYHYSVKCPSYYKDSAALDIIQCYCSGQNQKALIICSSAAQSELLSQSEFLRQKGILIHSGLDRRQRVRRGRIFQQVNKIKWLITNQVSSTHQKNIQANIIIFVSPPKNHYIYRQAMQFTKNVQYITVCYNTKQIPILCRLQNQLKFNFTILNPPQVDSIQIDENIKIQPLIQESKQLQYKLVFKNLDYQGNWLDLSNFLLKNKVYTSQVKVVIINKPNAISQRRKAGFVTCKDKQSYQKALKLYGTKYFNRDLLIYPYNVINKQKNNAQILQQQHKT